MLHIGSCLPACRYEARKSLGSWKKDVVHAVREKGAILGDLRWKLVNRHCD